MTDVETKTFPAEFLHEFATRAFEHYGIPSDEAHLAADVLAASDLRGIDSHGIARLNLYCNRLADDLINPRPKITIVRQTPSTATVDGDNGLGLVVGPKANNIAMDKADEVGSGWVSVCNTNHYGIAGYYALQGLARDIIGWSMTSSAALVAPLWGAERMLGTNPIAIAFPGKEEPPVVIDMATSAVAYGKIEIANRKNEPVPDGWAIDEDGNVTTDPMKMMEGGAMLPLGSDREHGGQKGYCLAAMVDMLTTVLSGANWGPFGPSFAAQRFVPEPARSVGKGIGHFFGAMRIDGFMDPDEFKTRVDDWVRTFRKTKPAAGTDGPLIPGDPERESEAIRSAQGIPLVMPVVEDLRDISKKTGIPFD